MTDGSHSASQSASSLPLSLTPRAPPVLVVAANPWRLRKWDVRKLAVVPREMWTVSLLPLDAIIVLIWVEVCLAG